MDVDAIIDDIFVGQERLSRNEIQRRAVAADAPAEVTTRLDTLPEGEYAEDELVEVLDQLDDLQPDLAASVAPEPAGESDHAVGGSAGVPGPELADDDLMRELGELHRTRNDTLRHGSDSALANHDERLAELEAE